MSLAVKPGVSAYIPESAPFSEEQRAWLNGFFAGVLSPDKPQILPDLPAAADPAFRNPMDDGDDGEAPWHDPALSLEERMALAAGRPVRRKMMAAMAQQDCGQCGSSCEDYSNSIAMQAEDRLNLCVPGGKQTARMLKALVEEMGGGADGPDAVKTDSAPAPLKTPLAAEPGYHREKPVSAFLRARRLLNGAGSEKATYHIEFDLAGANIAYEAGDSFGVFPKNDSALVASVIEAIGASPDFPIGAKTLKETLTDDVSLGLAPDMLLEFISYLVGGERRLKARALARGEDLDGDLATLDVLGALQKFGSLRPDPEAFIESLEPLQPRLYSISSSPKAEKDVVSLTVDHVRYEIDARERLGVASTFLSRGAHLGAEFRVYIQKAHNFALPAPSVPIIMVGPGTGIAPFRAFLHERLATKATGGAWLFFGHQRQASDFYYEDELHGLQAAGVLSKLSLAWSRDVGPKTYVQDKMREEAATLWQWLEQGAHFYICGDAKRMASDVEKTLASIIVEQGARDEAAAKAYLANLKKSGRYQADVY